MESRSYIGGKYSSILILNLSVSLNSPPSPTKSSQFDGKLYQAILHRLKLGLCSLQPRIPKASLLPISSQQHKLPFDSFTSTMDRQSVNLYIQIPGTMLLQIFLNIMSETSGLISNISRALLSSVDDHTPAVDITFSDLEFII